jgi:hypothetical protein
MLIDVELLHKILKYVAQGIVVFLLLKHNVTDISNINMTIIIALTLITTFIIFENINIVATIKKLLVKTKIPKITEDTMNSTELPPTQPPSEATIHIPKITPSIKTDDKQTVKIEKFDIDTKAKQTINKPIPQGEPVQNELVSVSNDGGYYIKFNEKPQVESIGSREKDDVMSDEIKYYDLNSLPIEGINSGSFEYGYSFLPPDRWFPVPAHPPICVCEKRCPVMPIPTAGLPVDLKDWNQTRRITQPDTINTSYVKEKLNSGR